MQPTCRHEQPYPSFRKGRSNRFRLKKHEIANIVCAGKRSFFFTTLQLKNRTSLIRKYIFSGQALVSIFLALMVLACTKGLDNPETGRKGVGNIFISTSENEEGDEAKIFDGWLVLGQQNESENYLAFAGADNKAILTQMSKQESLVYGIANFDQSHITLNGNPFVLEAGISITPSDLKLLHQTWDENSLMALNKALNENPDNPHFDKQGLLMNGCAEYKGVGSPKTLEMDLYRQVSKIRLTINKTPKPEDPQHFANATINSVDEIDVQNIVPETSLFDTLREISPLPTLTFKFVSKATGGEYDFRPQDENAADFSWYIPANYTNKATQILVKASVTYTDPESGHTFRNVEGWHYAQITSKGINNGNTLYTLNATIIDRGDINPHPEKTNMDITIDVEPWQVTNGDNSLDPENSTYHQ